MRIHTVQLNLGDLMGGTSRMDATEFGAYALLFLNCYQDSTHMLPLAESEIRAIARVTPKVWDRIRAKVMPKFIQTPTGWRHSRVDEELQKIARKSSKNSANALERWKTPNANALPKSEGFASGSQCDNDANQNPKTKTKKPKKYNYDDQDFETFWTNWPSERRCEKPKAWTAWQDAKRKCPAAQLLEYLQRYLQTKQVKEGFAPYPARWLKNERWMEVMDTKDGLAKAEFSLADLGESSQLNKEFFDILMCLKQSQGEAVFRSWIAGLRVYEKTDTELTLFAPTRFMAEWIKSHFDEALREAVKLTWPGVQTMKFKIRSGQNENLPKPTFQSATVE